MVVFQPLGSPLFLNRLISPYNDFAVDSCLSFRLMSERGQSFIRVVKQDADGALSEMAFFSDNSALWKERRVNISSGNYSVIFEDSQLFYYPYSYPRQNMYLDDVKVMPGYCQTPSESYLIYTIMHQY